MSEAVIFDSYCGEPLAWWRVGDLSSGPSGPGTATGAITERVSPADEVRKYGPVTEMGLGPHDGFKSATYGAMKFLAKSLDPRRTGSHHRRVGLRWHRSGSSRGSSPGESSLRRPGVRGPVNDESMATQDLVDRRA